ncbi:uncharacterized protein LOC130511177 [Raphanus sativus]|uniref:Uncharacterized protein LOC130511177 n=1 Tax=Raphanus sativus TaxID=3726 RepID=A0A9W3DJG5_RAPSA|nr:uncharacterized protein LOC130511177 [Raphanus sativus]
MRWHAEHVQKDGEVAHPSDARAWKHFNNVYPDFAENIRNVYLGLCTDGFSPFGMSGRQYSLWPVILTPYNLPPDICMEQEFLFLTILIPGPKHPKRSLDVFLQPLIQELKELSSEGVRTYDCSTKTNFTMRAVLLWMISDFPAYGMLSGWTTHGRRNKTLFRKNKVVRDSPPPYLTGQQIEEDIDYYRAQKTVKKGENWHVPGNMPDGYGVSHNWHKKKAKSTLFDWVASEVKFPDGNVSNLSRCIERGQKFSGMKSHDCHVFMQRLLPFAFAELLPKNVHEALAAIRAFFRDLSTRTFKEEVIEQLHENIPIIVCNLEKIFPPSFFDVMEHLVVHLPYEALLRGPVHNGWMYPYERSMKHLKGKARNLAKVEGSIVAGSLTAETSNFTSYYFASTVRTRKRVPKRYDDGGVPQSYAVDGVPDIFCQIGRFGGKLREVWWSSDEDKHSAHTYILLNCEDAVTRSFESLFVSQVEEAIPGISATEVDARKDKHFVKWLKGHVDYDDPYYPVWFHDLIQGPVAKATTSSMYFTRGFTFHTYEYGRHRIKCVLFKCEWFDPVENRGVRFNKFGVVDIHSGRRYNKFEPFILASQAEQVSFLPYPRLRSSRINWLTAIKITPRGRIVAGEEPPLQEEDAINEVEVPDQQTDEILLVDPDNRQYEDLPEDVTDEAREDEFDRSDDDHCSDVDENSNDSS